MFHFRRIIYGQTTNIVYVLLCANINKLFWFRWLSPSNNRQQYFHFSLQCMHDSYELEIKPLRALRNQPGFTFAQPRREGRKWWLTSAWCCNKIFIEPSWPLVAATCNAVPYTESKWSTSIPVESSNSTISHCPRIQVCRKNQQDKLIFAKRKKCRHLQMFFWIVHLQMW